MEINVEAPNSAPTEVPVAVEAQAPVSLEAAKEFGIAPVKRYVEVDGVIVPQDEVTKMREAGQDVSVHASAGRQS